MGLLILVFILGALSSVALLGALGLLRGVDSDGPLLRTSLPRSVGTPSNRLSVGTPQSMSGRLTVNGSSPTSTGRTEVYRLDPEDEARHVCRFCGLDLAGYDHSDCRRGMHGNE